VWRFYILPPPSVLVYTCPSDCVCASVFKQSWRILFQLSRALLSLSKVANKIGSKNVKKDAYILAACLQTICVYGRCLCILFESKAQNLGLLRPSSTVWMFWGPKTPRPDVFSRNLALPTGCFWSDFAGRYQASQPIVRGPGASCALICLRTVVSVNHMFNSKECRELAYMFCDRCFTQTLSIGPGNLIMSGTCHSA
jgi:hypothetical protein